MVEVLVNGRLVSDDLQVLCEAAEQGVGIARLPPAMVNGPIAKGTLVPLLDEHARPPMPVHLVYVGGRNMPARIRVFLDFIRPRLSQRLAEALGPRLSSPTAHQIRRRR